MPGQQRDGRPAVLCGWASLLLAGCIGLNPDFVEPPWTSSAASTSMSSTGQPAPETGTSTSSTSSSTTGPDSSSSIGGVQTTTSTSSTSSTSTRGSGGSSTGDIPCEESKTPYTVSLDLMFVLDRSAAMSTPWDHDGDDVDDDGLQDAQPGVPATAKVSRWSSVHAAVAVIAQRFDTSLRAGVALFPGDGATMTYDASACLVDAPVDLGVGPMHAAAIVAAIPPANAALVGARPATTAFTEAVQELADPDTRRKIVLVTAGAANCSSDAADVAALLEGYDESLHFAVFQAAKAGILTHVVGLEIADAISPTQKDSEPDAVNVHAKLNLLAQDGGAAKAGADKFWAASGEADLVAALDASVRAGLDCVVALDEPVGFPEAARLILDGTEVPQIQDCAGEDGWHFTQEGLYEEIELCGQACAGFQEGGALEFETYCVSG